MLDTARVQRLGTSILALDSDVNEHFLCECQVRACKFCSKSPACPPKSSLSMHMPLCFIKARCTRLIPHKHSALPGKMHKDACGRAMMILIWLF